MTDTGGELLMLDAKAVARRLSRTPSRHEKAWNKQPGATASGANSSVVGKGDDDQHVDNVKPCLI